MFCFQCQETAKNQGCTINGMCGKKGSTANLQDLSVDAMVAMVMKAGETAVTTMAALDQANT